MRQRVDLPDEKATREAAGQLAARLGPGSVVALVGPLGAGKTTLVRAVAGALGVTAEITSPTFVRLQIYPGRWPIYHLDLYRLRDGDEFLALGLDEWLDSDGVTLIEWADRIAGLLGPETLTVRLEFTEEEQGRTMTMHAGPPGAADSPPGPPETRP